MSKALLLGGLLVAAGVGVIAFSGDEKKRVPPPGVLPNVGPGPKVPPPGIDPGVNQIAGNIPGVSGGGPEQIAGGGGWTAPDEGNDVSVIGPDPGGLGLAGGVIEAFGNG